MMEEIHVFVTNSQGERVSIGAQANRTEAKKTIQSIKDLSPGERKKLGYSNPRIKTLLF